MKKTATCRAALLAAVLASASLAEAAPSTLVASTGLRTFLPHNVAMVTVSELALGSDGAAIVSLSLLDNRDRVLKTFTGTVRQGQPVAMRLLRDSLTSPVSAVRAVARVSLSGDPAADLVAPAMTFETWNPVSIDDLVAETCLLPAVRPDTGGGGPVGNCGGCYFDFQEIR